MTRPINSLDPDGSMKNLLRPDLVRNAILLANPSNYVDISDEADDIYAGSGALPLSQRMIEFIHDAGIYPGTTQGFKYIRSLSRNYEDVILETTLTSGGVLHAFGGNTWYEGITFRAKTHLDGVSQGPKYCVHITGAGTLVFINCFFENLNINSNNCIGLDGGDGLSLHFYKCRFKNLGSPLTNIHGAGGNSEGLDISFIDCTSDPGTPTAISYNDLGSGSRDRVHIFGGNLTAGDIEGSDSEFVLDGTWRIPVGGLAANHRYALLGE